MRSKLFTLGFVLILMSLILSTLIVSGCGTTTAEPANPASVHCEGRGYTLEMRTDADGGQYGVCIFPDGSECEEWAFYRGDCSPAAEQPAETPTTAPTVQATEQPAPVEGDFQPLDPAACGDLANALAQTLGVEAATADAPFQDRVSGRAGTGCQITAPGTGLDFEGHWPVYQELAAMLAAQGWQEDMMYQGGGPTGTLTGFRRSSELCLLLVGWEPSEDADCPTDQPIGMCELTPEQQLYTIVLNCATQPAEAQAPVEPAETWVYVDLMPDESGTTVTWIDSLSGAANSVPAPGTRYRVVGEWVYYQEGLGSVGTVHRVNGAGQDERFDFMDIPEDYWEGVDWVISPDGTLIVWNLFSFETGEGYEVTLTSDLYVATIASGETRLLTTYVVHEHQKLTPWGFSPDGSQVFVYQQPYGIGGLFAIYGEFSVLDVATGQLTPLPDPMATQPETTMGGAAALSDDGARLARFGYTEGEGFTVNLIELASGQTTEIATAISTDLGLVRVGDGVFSPDGSTLVYTVAYGDMGSETYALFQVDLTTGTQRELLAPQFARYKVVRFEDDGSLLLTANWWRGETGTFRLHPDGTLEHLSELTFVGVLQ